MTTSSDALQQAHAYFEVCQKVGHKPMIVERLPGHRTRLTCPRCRKSVIEVGLEDHPEAKP